VDHGKTTLTAAMTHILAKKYGGEAKNYDQIDARRRRRRAASRSTRRTWSTRRPSALRARGLPGHADYIKNMITGAADGRGDSGGLCRDGPMPQTREHILLARQVGVPYIVVF